MNAIKYCIGQQVYVLPLKGARDFNYLDRAIKEFGETGKLPMTGTVTRIRKSDDMAFHGSPLYEYYYDILGADNKMYNTGPTDVYGCVGNCVGDISIDGFMNAIQMKIKSNIETINKLKASNERYKNLLVKFRLLGN